MELQTVIGTGFASYRDSTRNRVGAAVALIFGKARHPEYVALKGVDGQELAKRRK